MIVRIAGPQDGKISHRPDNLLLQSADNGIALRQPAVQGLAGRAGALESRKAIRQRVSHIPQANYIAGVKLRELPGKPGFVVSKFLFGPGQFNAAFRQFPLKECLGTLDRGTLGRDDSFYESQADQLQDIDHPFRLVRDITNLD